MLSTVYCVFYIVFFMLYNSPILFIVILPYILTIQLLGFYSYNKRLSLSIMVTVFIALRAKYDLTFTLVNLRIAVFS